VITGALLVTGWIANRSPAIEKGPKPLYWVMSCVPIIWMAYRSVRHVPIAAIWVGPVIALLGSRIKTQHETHVGFRRTWYVLNALALTSVILTFAAVYEQPWPEIRAAGTVLGRKHPCRAVRFIRENNLSGNVYNPLHWGSYITWELYPAIRVSMDGRNISLFPDQLVLENLLYYQADQAEAEGDAAPLRYDTDFLIVPADFPALPRLLADTRWQKAYGDTDAVLFVRVDAAHRSLLESIANHSLKSRSESCPQVLE
jgi:hypothetical protein